MNSPQTTIDLLEEINQANRCRLSDAAESELSKVSAPLSGVLREATRCILDVAMSAQPLLLQKQLLEFCLIEVSARIEENEKQVIRNRKLDELLKAANTLPDEDLAELIEIVSNPETEAENEAA